MCCEDPKLSRREALGAGLRIMGGVAAALTCSKLIAQVPAPAPPTGTNYTPLAETDPNLFAFSRVQYVSTMQVADNWDINPAADECMLAYVRKATNIKMTEKSWADRVVSIDDADKINTLPFLFMTGEGTFDLSEKQAATFGEFFKRGGFLYADDCVIDRRTDYFFQCVRREFPKALPGLQFEPVPDDHPIYHCYYDFHGRAPFCSGTRHPDYGLFYEGRMVCFVTPGDVHCGWAPEHFFGMAKTEECYRFGTNLLVYGLTH